MLGLTRDSHGQTRDSQEQARDNQGQVSKLVKYLNLILDTWNLPNFPGLKEEQELALEGDC